MEQPALFVDDFEQFWALYPRKQAKQDARKAWSKLNPSADLVADILISVSQHCLTQEWRKDRGQFVPLPASFIRGERWTDELSATAEPSGESRKDCQHEPRCNSSEWHWVMLQRDRQKAGGMA